MMQRKYVRHWCSGLLLLWLLAVSAQTLAVLTQQQKLLDTGGQAGAKFGSDAAISGDTAVVGAPEEGSYKGAAIVFEKNTQGQWEQVAKLTASDGTANDYFGWQVDISGDVVVVGNNGGMEKAHVFVKPVGGWSDMTETAVLRSSDYSTTQTQRFGAAVAMENDTIVIGAPSRSNIKGAVYLFIRPATGWADVGDETALFVAPDGADGDQLGQAVSIDADVVVAGAPTSDSDAGSGNSNVGAVYLFEKTGADWSAGYTDSKIIAGDDLEFANFGHALDISGETVVVGKEGPSDQPGKVFLFEKPATGWADTGSPAAVLSQSDDRSSFGEVLAVRNGQVMAGDTTQRVNGQLQGVVYVFDKPVAGWQTTATPDAELTASDAGFGDFFGSSLAMEADTLLIGARGDDVGGNTDQGSVYVFAPPPPNSPEIVVAANGNNIENDGREPSTSDGTDVGVVEVQRSGAVITFTVTNTGSDVLNLGSITLEYPGSGTTTDQDIYLNPPASSVLAVGENTSFLVIIVPKSMGLHSAVVNIPSNDSDEDPFRIKVQGTGGPGLTVVMTGKYGTVSSGDGGISCSETIINCHQAYDLDEPVTLQIVPDTGATLSTITWGDACSGATGDSCDLVMDDTKNVSAAFTCMNLKLDTIVVGSKSWDCMALETIPGFWVPGPAAGQTNEAVLRATDHILLGKETKVLKGGVLRVVIVP